MKFVVDTNIILSSLLAPSSPPKQVLDTIIEQSHILVMSLAMAAELGAVIVRPKFSRLGTEKERVNSVQIFLSAPHIKAIVPPFAIAYPSLTDVDDNRILETALASQADLIVTGDKELLDLGQIVSTENNVTLINSPIRILSASDALDFLLSN